MPENYYIVLGIGREADIDKIKKAYRSIAKKFHPDVAAAGISDKKFREVKEAYETLADESKRREYDEMLNRQGSKLRISKVADVINRRTSFSEMSERLFSTPTDDFLEGFLPGFFDSHKGRLTEKDLFFEAILSPEEAIIGGIYPITVPVLASCPRCTKTGFWEGFFCPVCIGYGRVRSERKFSLTIPPGVKHGTKIQLSMEDIGLRNSYLNVLVTIDPDQDNW